MNRNMQHIVDELLEDPSLHSAEHAPEMEAGWVSIEPVVGDQRRSYRYPAQPGQEEAALRRKGKLQRAELIEESAGGFALGVPNHVLLQPGEILEVKIYSGWYRARVVHLQPNDGNQRVGFERVAVVSTSKEAAIHKRGGEHREPSSWSGKLLVVAVAIMLGGGLILSVSGKSLWQFVSGNAATVATHIPPQFAKRPPNPQLLGMLDSVNILSHPEIAKDLGLSPGQQKSLEGIFTGASNSLAELYEKSKNQSPEVWYIKSQAVMNEALENILCSMTDAQVVKWRRHLIAKRQAESGK